MSACTLRICMEEKVTMEVRKAVLDFIDVTQKKKKGGREGGKEGGREGGKEGGE